MPNLTVRNIPKDLYAVLRRDAGPGAEKRLVLQPLGKLIRRRAPDRRQGFPSY